MAKDLITFKIVAYTDAAGKFDSDAYRSGNEDNFYVDDNLGDETLNHCVPDEPTVLSDEGLLMVVADGMGGMNAGEVASQIAVDTVKDYFAVGKISKSLASTHESRTSYLEQVVKEADKRIKNEAKNNLEHKGMGSTIILAWVCRNELSICWCGDSRAYLFNQATGIRLISEDHSYVQELVNKGMLTYDQTFDHPQNNVITRSLGDPTKDAKPESRLYKLAKGDIILLCSDGLSGVLRDRKTYDSDGKLLEGENIEDILRVNDHSMKECREALWRAAERSDWYDNVTAILCKITDGDERNTAPTPIGIKTAFFNKTISMRSLLLGLFFFIVVAIGGCFVYKHFNAQRDFLSSSSIDSIKIDTIKVDTTVSKKSNNLEMKSEVTKSQSTAIVDKVMKQNKIQESKVSKKESKQSELTKVESNKEPDKSKLNLIPNQEKEKADKREEPPTEKNNNINKEQIQ